MAATQGASAFNTQIQINTTGSTYVNILEPKDISGPNITAEMIDFTHQQSPAGYREQKPSFKSGGTVTFRCNFVHTDAGQQALIVAANANPPTLKHYKEIFPDNTVIDFDAYASIAWNNPMNGPEEINVTLNITGALGIAMPSPSISASASASASAS
jgi:hypothetical protein